MKHLNFSFLMAGLVLFCSCSHSSLSHKNLCPDRLALDNLHPMPADLPLHPDDIPGNDNAARAALFHISDASPASYAWRILYMMQDFEQHPLYNELLARLMLSRDETEAALHVADTRLDMEARFRIYRACHSYFLDIGQEKHAQALFVRLKKSFPHKERKDVSFTLHMMDFYRLQGQYKAAVKYFKRAEQQLQQGIMPDKNQQDIFHNLRQTALMAIEEQDPETALRIVAAMEAMVDFLPVSRNLPETGYAEDMGHTVLITGTEWFQPGAAQSIAKIYLLRTYAEMGEKNQVLRLYHLLMEEWHEALKAIYSGKSFEARLPSLAEALYAAGLQEEALNLINQIPKTFPFAIHPDTRLNPETQVLLQSDLRRYNFQRPGRIQRNIALRMAALMGPEKDEEQTLAWIKTSTAPSWYRDLLIRATETRLEAGRNAELLLSRLDEIQKKTAYKDPASLENRRIIRALLLAGRQAEARTELKKEVEKIKRGLYGSDQARQLAALARVFVERDSVTAEKVLLKALRFHEDTEAAPRKADSSIQLMATVARRLDNCEIKHTVLELHRINLLENVSTHAAGLGRDRHLEKRFASLLQVIRTRLLFNVRDNLTRSLLWECEELIAHVENPDLAYQLRFRTAELWCSGGWFRDAYRTMEGVPVSEEIFPFLITRIRQNILGYSAFSGNQTARFDTDADGRPDFFSPLASEDAIKATGLTMDTDMDGDGIPDTEDLRPWFPDS
ncbi:hypothetical protein LZ24_00164 [Desulfobotulus alkaliphilus]|uniref:Uncharacterized protein n=1 Tax=Desulfobotulus alkaliphilus TaxID=622671 RepID=A0A562S7G0_9BACT|nr:hypothetical protein [Desulfobotulus alkaliphilus]TWI77355.1 hypothetical protein LZ24_00164 [Desulfobotulus alkaliphilus]